MTRTRILAALVMAPLAIAAILLLPTQWLMALVAVIFLVGLWEWLKLAGIDDTLHRTVLLVANVALMAGIVWAGRGSVELLQLTTLLGAAGWLAALAWLRSFDFASGSEPWMRAVKIGAGTLAVVPAWCALALIHKQGHMWLLTALVIVWAADAGAYFAGRQWGGKWFGGCRLAPRISPNKTLEGLAGGLLTAIVFGLLLAAWAGMKLTQIPVMTLLIVVAALFSVVGDLLESLLKRHAGVKDSSHLIPGHGGALDRIDSVLSTLPVFAIGMDLLLGLR
jgi:phosphatidate cytidylyltransferase